MKCRTLLTRSYNLELWALKYYGVSQGVSYLQLNCVGFIANNNHMHWDTNWNVNVA